MTISYSRDTDGQAVTFLPTQRADYAIIASVTPLTTNARLGLVRRLSESSCIPTAAVGWTLWECPPGHPFSFFLSETLRLLSDDKVVVLEVASEEYYPEEYVQQCRAMLLQMAQKVMATNDATSNAEGVAAPPEVLSRGV